MHVTLVGRFAPERKVAAIHSSYCTDALEASEKKTSDNEANAKATSAYAQHIQAMENTQGRDIPFIS